MKADKNKQNLEAYSYKPTKKIIDLADKLIKDNPILIKRLEDA